MEPTKRNLEYHLFNKEVSKDTTKVLVTKDLKILYDCVQADSDLFVNCREITTYHAKNVENCAIDIRFDEAKIPEETFDLALSIDEKSSSKSITFPCKDDPNQSIRTSLEFWIKDLKNANFSWNHFTTDFSPIDVNNPKIEINLDLIKNRPGFKSLDVQIESVSGDHLFQGKMINGVLSGMVDQSLVDHPGWRTRLRINFSRVAINLEVSPEKATIQEFYVRAVLKNGKLHGLIQIFGIFTRDPQENCGESVYPGLSFVGWFQEGVPFGACWRQLVGDSWIYGKVDGSGRFTGEKNVAYIYQDLELTMVGKYTNGIFVSKKMQLQNKKKEEFLIFFPPD